MKNNLIDLYREYVRCADMCNEYNKEHRTEIKPRDCVQLKSATGEWVGYFSLNEPNFVELLEHKVRFAVAILRGRTVFPGDTVYSPTNTKVEVKATSLQALEGVNSGWNLSFEIISDEWSWEQQKKPRTFTLNGVELPCPFKSNAFCNAMSHAKMSINDREFYFKSVEDRQQWWNMFRRLLEQARDKE